MRKGKKVRLIQSQIHLVNDGSVDCKKTDSLGSSSLRHQLAQVWASFLPYDLFFMRRDSLSILKACSYIFYLICASGSHVTWNSAVPDPNVWCCILLFLCTLEEIEFDFFTAWNIFIKLGTLAHHVHGYNEVPQIFYFLPRDLVMAFQSRKTG